MWKPFDKGATVGQPGYEGGVVVRDEEHQAGARATLERECEFAPWTVTCGVYGWFFHTRFLASEAEAEFPAMLDRLAKILDMVPLVDDPDCDAKMRMVGESISAFVDRFP